MKISKLQIVGVTLVVMAALAIVLLQVSGHGMITTVSDPTPEQTAVFGDKLVKVTRIVIPLSFRVLKWVALFGVVCTVIPLIPRHAKTNA